jgi:SAM-dependent methyltransferase
MKDDIAQDILIRYLAGFMSLAKELGLHPDTHRLTEGKSYPFIPHDPVDLVHIFTNVEKYLYNRGIKHDPTFLDAGCGVGNIMALAHSVGFDVSGIDINPDLIELAHHLFRHTQNYELDICDILSYNRYNEFDIIYYFCPIQDIELEKQFEKKVETDAKRGAIIIAALKRDRTIYDDSRFNRLECLESMSSAKVFQKR